MVAFLAAASVGAVWALCAPDMGPVSVGDRYRQIEPKVLVAVDGYRHAGKPFDRRAALGDILDQLPTVSHGVWVPCLDPAATPPAQAQARTVVHWAEAVAGNAPLQPVALAPGRSLWTLYSSGTTGLPKAIVHGHGGVLANSLANMVLHNDLHPGDRVLWAVNTSWMVWNAHVTGLLGGATIVLYDGCVSGAGPEPDWAHLWRLVGRLRVTTFGVGQPVMDAVGELVCTRPIPSMPLYFGGDTDSTRYKESYFDTFQDADQRPVWRQGDWLRLVERPEAVGGIIYGRTDATINRQGVRVRMGTAELYRVVERLDDVLDTLVVDLEYLGRPSYLALFVQLRTGATLDEPLRQRIRQALRSTLSVRHVPDEILQVPVIPKTITGKKLELPVKKLLLGHPAERVLKRDALAQPDSIDWFVQFAADYLARTAPSELQT